MQRQYMKDTILRIYLRNCVIMSVVRPTDTAFLSSGLLIQARKTYKNRVEYLLNEILIHNKKLYQMRYNYQLSKSVIRIMII